MKRLVMIILFPVFVLLFFVGMLLLDHHSSVSDTVVHPSNWILSSQYTAFYPRNIPNNCIDILSKLDQGKLALDVNSDEVIGMNPVWKDKDTRTGFFNFNLHSLRFTVCLIKEGKAGNLQRFKQAKKIIFSWLESNPESSPASKWSWTEHATSWRSIVLAYFIKIARQYDMVSPEELLFLDDAVYEHINFVKRTSEYKPDHNHGLNNALALISLGLAVIDSEEQKQLLDLGFSRAMQQMADNVSLDGVHLEHSGFYQFYTIRTFLEIFQVSRAINWPLPSIFKERLAKMIKVASCMAGQDGIVDGLPYSKPNQLMTNIFESNMDVIQENYLMSDDGLPIKIDTGCNALSVFKEGGYSFFPANELNDIELVFHTRVLDAPHAHKDALGITMRTNDGPFIVLTSAMNTSEDDREWKKYFLGSVSHNGVTVEGAEQHPLSRRRPGVLFTIADSYKVNSWIASIGLMDEFTAIRRRSKLDRLPLRERLDLKDGEVLSFGSNEISDYVTARNEIYDDIEHTRTVARINGRLMIVWDRLQGKEVNKYTQRFHFNAGFVVKMSENNATVFHDRNVIARAKQLMPASERVCVGEIKPERCGWYTDSPSIPKPAPELLYTREGIIVEFLWVIQLGDSELKIRPINDYLPNEKKYLVEMNGYVYEVIINNAKVVVEQRPGKAVDKENEISQVIHDELVKVVH